MRGAVSTEIFTCSQIDPLQLTSLRGGAPIHEDDPAVFNLTSTGSVAYGDLVLTLTDRQNDTYIAGTLSQASPGGGDVTAGQLAAEAQARSDGDAARQLLDEKNQLGGYPGLDPVTGLLSASQIPAVAITNVYTVNTVAQMVALEGSPTFAGTGDVCVVIDDEQNYIHNGGTAGTFADWTLLLAPVTGGGAVLGVGPAPSGPFRTGNIALVKADVGLDLVNNTPDSAKPVSTAQQAAIDLSSQRISRRLMQTTTTSVTKDDAGKSIENNHATEARTITIPSAATDPTLLFDMFFEASRTNGGELTVKMEGSIAGIGTPLSAPPVNSVDLLERYSQAQFRRIGATDLWICAGDVTA